MKLKLIVVRGYSPGMAIPVALRQFLIGRDTQCHLRPVSLVTSRLHCEILRGKDAVSVRDLESTNGTFINGSRLISEMEVRSGDTLQIGPLVFRFEIDSRFHFSLSALTRLVFAAALVFAGVRYIPVVIAPIAVLMLGTATLVGLIAAVQRLWALIRSANLSLHMDRS